ncbi:hypothetical protein OROHE_008204 [Orobanche hederae]
MRPPELSTCEYGLLFGLTTTEGPTRAPGGLYYDSGEQSQGRLGG